MLQLAIQHHSAVGSDGQIDLHNACVLTCVFDAAVFREIREFLFSNRDKTRSGENEGRW